MEKGNRKKTVSFEYLYEGKARGIRYSDFSRLLKEDEYLSRKLQGKTKLVYCVLYNMSINICSTNGWVDQKKRMYILPPIYGMSKYFQITKEEIDEAIKELDEKTGIGLIRCVPAGESTNYKIYVKNFAERIVSKKEPVQMPLSSDAEVIEVFIQALKKQVEYEQMISHSRLGDIVLIGKIFGCLLKLLLTKTPETELGEKTYSTKEVRKALCFVDRSYFERLLRELHREEIEEHDLKPYICHWLIKTAVTEAAPILELW